MVKGKEIMNLSVYTPIAHDFKFSFATIISYYEIADEIILGIDNKNISWSNKKYSFDIEKFFERVKEIDRDSKIKIIFSDFHTLNDGKKNQNRQRRFLASICNKQNFVLAIDSDEILLNPFEFKKWLDSNEIKKDIGCTMYSIYKNFGDKLLITLPDEYQNVGTYNITSNPLARFNQKNNIISPLKILIS